MAIVQIVLALLFAMRRTSTILKKKHLICIGGPNSLNCFQIHCPIICKVLINFLKLLLLLPSHNVTNFAITHAKKQKI